MAYETVIGLEVHAQLCTRSKIFCASSAAFGAAPNAHTCTVDLGLPGVLPVLNREVVEFTLRLGLAVGAEVAPECRFARKHYFYPDLPKGYQISQYEEPICKGGEVHLLTKNGAERLVRLTRIHMEEDAGKLIHGEELGDPAHSYVDFNRAGVPLLEIVTEPDLRNPEEAEAFLRKLRTLVVYLGICDGNMQEGSLRCDANISLRPAGSEKFGAKVEIKNINSFRNLRRALEYEEVRQAKLLDAGKPIEQETRLWNESQGATLGMRSKEYAHDYRYFPDPDLVPLQVGKEWLDRVRAQLPELPDAKRERFRREYGLPPYDAEVLTEERALADYYEEVVETTGLELDKVASNWVMGEFLRLLNEQKVSFERLAEMNSGKVKYEDHSISSPKRLGQLIKLHSVPVPQSDTPLISGTIAKAIFPKMSQGEYIEMELEEIVKREGGGQITEVGITDASLEIVIGQHGNEYAEYRGGKDKLSQFFVGQTMKATRGKAKPSYLQEVVKSRGRSDMKERWEDNVHYYDYTVNSVRTMPTMDAVVVAEAWVYDPDRNRNCGLMFFLTGPAQSGGVSVTQAIESAERERSRLVEEVRAQPKWGKVAHVNWDGTILRWLEQGSLG